MWQGFSRFPGYLHHVIITKLATSRVRVKAKCKVLLVCLLVLDDFVGVYVLNVNMCNYLCIFLNSLYIYYHVI